MKSQVCFKLLYFLVMVSVFITMVSAAQTWINETVTVSNLSYRAWSGSLDAGDRLTGSMYGSGDVNFYILDSNNYMDFSSGGSFYASYSRSRVSSLPSIDFTVPSSGTWYIVLDNQYSIFTSKSVAITIDRESVQQSSGSFLVTVVTIMAIVGVVVVGVAAMVAYSTRVKRTRIEAVPKPPS